MKVLIWTHHPGDLLGEVIDFLTHGTAQHAGFLRANGMIHEAYFPQVRDRAMLDSEKPFIKTFYVKDITPQQEALFEAAFDAALKIPVRYDIGDLFGFLFNRPNTNENETFCSRYVYHLCKTILPGDMWPQIRVMDDDWLSPRDLWISNLLIPESAEDSTK